MAAGGGRSKPTWVSADDLDVGVYAGADSFPGIARTMSTTTGTHPLLAGTNVSGKAVPPEPLLSELRSLAAQDDHCTARSRRLYEQIRKMLGQDRLEDCLRGIQFLAAEGEPGGARLLAALLDANAPGTLLLPRIRRLTSTARLINIGDDRVGEAFLRDWQARLADLTCSATDRVGPEREDSGETVAAPADRAPMPLLRRALTTVAPSEGETTTDPADLELLARLIRLECDAYQERVSRLAGSIDPFRITAVMRALPILNRADAEIRDLNRLAAWLEAGDADAAFRKQVATGHDVLDEGERPHLAAALRDGAGLEPLAAVYGSFLAQPTSIRQLAGPVARLLVVGHALAREGQRDTDLDLLSAVAAAQSHGTDGRLSLPLTPELETAVGNVLLRGKRGGSDDLAGLEIVDGHLVLQNPQLGLGDRIWRHDLPTLLEMQGRDPQLEDLSEETEEEAEDRSATAVKQMVMNNMGCVSILLGFLRNPKVTSIPGLVADVVRRTRTGQILEVVAKDRRLTSGHANKDVPRALIESPVNVPVKSLRKFIHVKYISKTDLRRLARDKSRLRKEVCEEIQKYLDSLG